MYMSDDTSKHLILLAEDDQALRELYAMALIKAGLDVVLAEDGEQAAAFALEKHPDLVLLDIDMPRMNGHQVAQKIRTDSWGRTARIIFLTNHSDPSNVAHAVMQKPEEYIVKAHTPIAEIVNQVRTAVYGHSKAL
jgi:two-component system response regulator MtrA